MTDSVPLQRNKMLLKDYLIIDNVLDDPKYAISLAKQTEFFCKTPFDDPNLKHVKFGDMPKGNWYGCRSKPLHVISQVFFERTFNHIFELCFPCNYGYLIDSYFHLSNENIKTQLPPIEWWHKDYPCFYSGVIFLNETPKKNSGTLLKLNNEELVIENHFNRLILYKSNILHRPQDFFGSNLEDTRLTLVFFINEIILTK